MENSQVISGSEQAAVLLLMMGEERAAKILQYVDYEAVEKIGTAMANIKQVDSGRAFTVCNRFREELNNHTPLGIGVPGYVRNLLVKSMGEQTGSTLADRLLGNDSPRELDSLRWMDPDTILHMLEDEHPQIIAITLAHLDQNLGRLWEALDRLNLWDRIIVSAMRSGLNQIHKMMNGLHQIMSFGSEKIMKVRKNSHGFPNISTNFQCNMFHHVHEMLTFFPKRQ